MLAGGGSAILYDIEAGRLLPRPKGLFVIPATDETRQGAERLRLVAELLGDVVDRGDRILISIDDTSLALYEVEQLSTLPFPASEWAMRIDTNRMIAVLERLGPEVDRRARGIEPLADLDRLARGQDEQAPLRQLGPQGQDLDRGLLEVGVARGVPEDRGRPGVHRKALRAGLAVAEGLAGPQHVVDGHPFVQGQADIDGRTGTVTITTTFPLPAY